MRKLLLAVSLLSAALLLGCAGGVIKKHMDGMIGQPLSAMISKLGVPTDERMIAGQKVYIWHTGTFSEGTQLQCTIRVIMQGTSDVIASWDFEGNEGRCLQYANMLER